MLLHSGVSDHAMWDGVAPVLARSHTVVRYDLRGYGSSSPPTAGFRHTDDLVDLLTHLGISEAALVGNSLGGRVALDLAWAMPATVTRLVLLAPPLGGWKWSAPFRDYIAAEEAALDAGDIDGALRINLDMWIRGPARPWSQALRALADRVAGPMRISLINQQAIEGQHLDERTPPAAEHLAEVRQPTLVGVGDQDVADFIAIAEHLAATIPAARAVRFAGAGHLIPLERPGEVADGLARFLGPG
ncbi:MAG TPA: alpha/beta hydrolase [Pilimelia sp.]|nr:alpha/beta hydrolase [Pilimelia sp.]